MTFPAQEPIAVDADHYFTIAELRASAKELESTTKFPDATLEAKRQEAEDDFEAIAHRAFVPRTDTCSVWMDGDEQYLFLNFCDIRTVVSVADGETPISTSGVVTNTTIGALRHPSRWPKGVLTVTYSHGMDEPPAAVKRAVLSLAKIYALPSSIDPRATAVINTEVGGYRLSVANAKTGGTGIPDVDAAARRYGDNTPAVG